MMVPATTSVITQPKVLCSNVRLRPRLAARCQGAGETTPDEAVREVESTRGSASSASSKKARRGVMRGLGDAGNTSANRLAGRSVSIRSASSRPAADKASFNDRERAPAAGALRPPRNFVFSIQPSLDAIGASLMYAFRPPVIMLKTPLSGQCRLHCKNCIRAEVSSRLPAAASQS